MTQAKSVSLGVSNFNSSGVLQPAGGGTGVTTSTGSGSVVLGTSPALTTPTIDKINTSVANTSLGAGNASAMKNRIINGAMVIDQRNAGAEVNPAINGAYYLDRWVVLSSAASKLKIGQNAGGVTPPSGFSKYAGITSLSSYSVSASDFFQIKQVIEGHNVADLDWGTVNAKTITVSFWVRSSLTGNFGMVLTWGSSAGNQRSYPILYTVASANTWEQKTITITGDTTMPAGGFETGSSASIQLRFSLGGGATNAGASGSWATANYQTVSGDTSVVGTSGATFYITGIQLEVGSSATGFEYRQYGQEIALCQRYFQKVGDGGNPYAVLGVGRFSSTTNASLRFPWSVVMRATPTASFNTATYQFTDGTSSRSVGAISIYSGGTDGCEGDVATTSATNGGMTQLRGNAASPNAPYINLSAEL